MVKAYIGIANSVGLQAFIHDDDRLLALIAPRAGLTPSQQRACFWAAVRDDVAKAIRQELLAGHRRQALLPLDSLGTDIATLGW
jgi:hypothetical protein